MDKRTEILSAIFDDPGVYGTVTILRESPSTENAMAALDRIRKELHLFCDDDDKRLLLHPKNPDRSLHDAWNSLVCEVSNSMIDLEKEGMKGADAFLLSLLTGNGIPDPYMEEVIYEQ
jgi:hypothetical protein